MNIFPTLKDEEEIKVLVSIIGLFITLSIFILARYQGWKSGDGYIVKALAGDNEALAIVCHKMRNGRWRTRFFRRNTRKDIIHALCLGWSFDHINPYTKVLIFDTLMKIKTRGKGKEIVDEVNRIENKISLYLQNFDSDVFNDRITKNRELLEKLNLSSI